MFSVSHLRTALWSAATKCDTSSKLSVLHECLRVGISPSQRSQPFNEGESYFSPLLSVSSLILTCPEVVIKNIQYPDGCQQRDVCLLRSRLHVLQHSLPHQPHAKLPLVHKCVRGTVHAPRSSNCILPNFFYFHLLAMQTSFARLRPDEPLCSLAFLVQSAGVFLVPWLLPLNICCLHQPAQVHT